MKARGFLSFNMILLVAAAAAAIGAAAWLRHSGVTSERAKWEAVQKEERAARREMISGLALELANERNVRSEDRRQATNHRRDLAESFKGKVNEFVPKTADSSTCLRAGFVRFADAAAAGVPLAAGPEPGSAAAASGVETDEAAAVIAENYGYYHECEARVADVLTEFDAIRNKVNKTVAAINARARETQ